MSATPQGFPAIKISRGELAINAAKAGKLTLRDLAEFAQQQGCELRVNFVKPAARARKEARVIKAIAPLADAMEFRP